MELRFPEDKISYWAERYTYPRQESRLLSFRDTVQQVGYLTREQLVLLAKWKSPRRAALVAENSEHFVQEITGFALNAKDERSRIAPLTLLDGISWPTASVILHLFHKEKYPILDFRALWSLSTDKPQLYTFPFWWKYVQSCRRLSERNQVEMRLLDQALWQYSKANQP
jgi:hypothetical protein